MNYVTYNFKYPIRFYYVLSQTHKHTYVYTHKHTHADTHPACTLYGKLTANLTIKKYFFDCSIFFIFGLLAISIDNLIQRLTPNRFGIDLTFFFEPFKYSLYISERK